MDLQTRFRTLHALLELVSICTRYLSEDDGSLGDVEDVAHQHPYERRPDAAVRLDVHAIHVRVPLLKGAATEKASH